MSQFSLKTFLRKTPYTEIITYFQFKKFLNSYDWGNSFDLESLSSAIMADGSNETILSDFEHINSMANENGRNTFIDQSKSPIHNLDIVPELVNVKSDHELSMRVFLNYPKLFHWTYEMIYLDSLTTSSWKTFFIGQDLQYSDSVEARTQLSSAIAKYYHQQGRGKYCLVDYYFRVNPNRYCFFAYPESYTTEDLVYDDENNLNRRIRRPVVEVIFVYNPSTGMLFVHVKGDKFAKTLAEIFCKQALELEGIPDESTRIYDLSPLKDANFRFVTDPSDNIELILLKSIDIHLPGLLSRKLSISANPVTGHENIVFEMMDKALEGFNFDRLDPFYIKKAKIAVKFRASAGQRARSVTFAITSPNGCTLNDVPIHNTIKKYLEKWGFVRTLINKENAA
jgi:hypothetical protein